MTEIEPYKKTELEVSTEVKAKELAERYAGFTDPASLSFEERVLSLVSLVPMSLEIVEEARDTIERLNDVIEQLERVRDKWASAPISRSRLWRDLDRILRGEEYGRTTDQAGQ